MSPPTPRQLLKPSPRNTLNSLTNISSSLPSRHRIRVVPLVNTGFDEFLGEEDGGEVEAFEILGDV